MVFTVLTVWVVGIFVTLFSVMVVDNLTKFLNLEEDDEGWAPVIMFSVFWFLTVPLFLVVGSFFLFIRLLYSQARVVADKIRSLGNVLSKLKED